jgi:hypothetical protein
MSLHHFAIRRFELFARGLETVCRIKEEEKEKGLLITADFLLNSQLRCEIYTTFLSFS